MKGFILLSRKHGRRLWLAQCAGLLKGASHKYIKRVPTGKTTKSGKPVYRYYYHVGEGGGVAREDHMGVGSSFAADGGHYHVKAENGKYLTVEHDETGETKRWTRKQLAAKLEKEHKSKIESHRKAKIEAYHKAVKGDYYAHTIEARRKEALAAGATAKDLEPPKLPKAWETFEGRGEDPNSAPTDWTGHPLAEAFAKYPRMAPVVLRARQKGITRGRGEDKVTYNNPVTERTMLLGYSHHKLVEDSLQGLLEAPGKVKEIAMQAKGRDKDGNPLEITEEIYQRAYDEVVRSWTDTIARGGEPIEGRESGYRTITVNGAVVPGVKVWRGPPEAYTGKGRVPEVGEVHITCAQLKSRVIEEPPNGWFAETSTAYDAAKKAIIAQFPAGTLRTAVMSPNDDWSLKFGDVTLTRADIDAQLAMMKGGVVPGPAVGEDIPWEFDSEEFYLDIPVDGVVDLSSLLENEEYIAQVDAASASMVKAIIRAGRPLHKAGSGLGVGTKFRDYAGTFCVVTGRAGGVYAVRDIVTGYTEGLSLARLRARIALS